MSKHKNFRKEMLKLHDLLLDNYKEVRLTSDMGDMEDGWVAYTISCKKKDLMKEINDLIKKHKEGYSINEKDDSK